MIEVIKKRIEENRTEIAILQSKHDAIIIRFQQLSGAIAELELLLNHFEKDLNGQDESKLSEVNRL